MRKVIVVVLALLFVFAGHGFSQNDSLSPPGSRLKRRVVFGASLFLGTSSLVGLNEAWYKDYRSGKFHFFNDNREWLQMDKAGHVYSTYQMADLMMRAFDWAGYSRKKKLFIGGGIGFTYLMAVECLDGFSEGWGYSWGDALANLVGTSVAVGQEALWNEQRIRLKFSYAESGLAQYNPSLLGKSPYSRLIKDYNGQTYWLSVNPFSFGKPRAGVPYWLCLSVGYSAYGMLGGHQNLVLPVNKNGYIIKYERERRFYLSLDVDLTRIKTKSKTLKRIFTAFNILKIPAPTIQWSGNQLRFYYIYY